VGYVLWMAANGYAVWGTMVSASVLLGICSSILWTAQGSYLTIVAHKYAELTQETSSAVMARFFGLFFAVYKLSK